MEPQVYPACAGIDLLALRKKGRLPGLPRMRGDRPSFFSWYNGASWFTPHARGSTLDRGFGRFLESVYPACAGIDRDYGFFGEG